MVSKEVGMAMSVGTLFLLFVMETDRDQRIAELERHIATIAQQIASIKSQKKKKPEKVIRRTSKPAVKEKKQPPVVKEKRKRVTKKKEPQTAAKLPAKQVVEEFPEFTFQQKKDLSEQINELTGDRLNTVVNIIQSSMPNLNGVSMERETVVLDATGHLLTTMLRFLY